MNRLIIIFSTDFKIREMIEGGLWERFYYELRMLSRAFQIGVYSSDTRCYDIIMPPYVRHMISAWKSDKFGFRHILFYLFLLKKSFRWRKEKGGVIIVYSVSNPVLPLIRLLSGKKIVTRFGYNWGDHTAKNYGGIKSIVSHSVQYLSLKASDHVICTMEWLCTLAENKYSKLKSTLIPNFVDLQKFCPSEQKKPQILFVGRLHWHKGVDLLIEAFAEFSKRYPEYYLAIIGKGEEQADLKKLCGTNKRISFCGSLSHSDVARWMSESEIFVLPSRTMEGHSRALAEAMASGCKCIVSDVPGNRDAMVESDSTELMFRKGDPRDLFKKLLFAVSYSSKSQYHYAVRFYDPDILLEKQISVLKNHIC